jgi:hypothetical protein
MSVDVLDRVLDPLTACLSVDVAERIAQMRADDETQATVDHLAEKANEGTLSEEERRLYDEYLQVFHFVTILQSKARRFLQKEMAG